MNGPADREKEDGLPRSLTLQNASVVRQAPQRAEEALLRTKEFHDAVMSSMGEGLYVVDAQGAVIYINPAAERLLARTGAELLGRNIHDVIHYKHLDGSAFPAAECASLGVLRDGKPVKDHDDAFIRKDGSFLQVTYSTSPIRMGDKVVGLVVVFRDVSERRQAEEIRLNLAAIVESSDDAIISKDLNGVIRSWNQGAARMFGYTADEVIGKSITVLLPLERVQEETEILRRLRHGERVDHFDTVRRHKSGRLFDVSVTISPIRDSTGRIIGASKIARDITARKRAEQTARFLASAHAALTDLTDFQSTLQKVASLCVPAFADWCAVDLTGLDGTVRPLTIVHANTSKMELAREIQRRFPPQFSDGFGVAKVLRTRRSEWAAEITETALTDALKSSEHLQLVRGLGLRSYICVPLCSRTKTIGALTFATAESGRNFTRDDLGIAEDLAARVVIALENANLFAALKDTDRRKDEFLAMLAHELRNPLAPIRNAVDIMRAQESPDRETQWARDVIDRQLDQMTRLIDDLLDVSRITRGAIELRKEDVALAAVVANAAEASRPLIEARRHELTISLPTDPIILNVDPARLAQVLSNLLNNAAKYMEEGGHIWLTGASIDDQIVIRVKDTGVGISADKLPCIFDMFTQVEHSLERSQGGLGIGLTLVRRLVALHGGTVTASSDGLGKGSEFVVRLPAARPINHGGTLQDVYDAGKGPAAPTLRILVVDDNKDAANGLAKLLHIAGHVTKTAFDGLEALGAAATFQPDVVVLDIGLPKLNGYDVAQRIRADRGDIVILIAVTGWGQETDRRRSKEAGFDHHVTKPIEFAAMKKLLASLALPRGQRST